MSRAEAVQLGARVAAAMVAVGVVVGLLWWWLAPVAAVRIESGGGYFVDPDPETYIASDLWFAGLSAVAGVVGGVLLWRMVHRAAVAGVIGLAAGGLLGALVAAWLGQRLGHVDPNSVTGLPVGTVVHVSLSVEATAVLLVLPVAALVGWLVRDLLHDRATTRADRATTRAERAEADDAAEDGAEAAAEVSRLDPPAPPPLPSA